MNRKGSSQSMEDPYQVIRKLRQVMQQQQKQLQEYQMVCDSVTFEKSVAVNEIANLKREIEYLSLRFQQQKTNKSTMGHSSSANLFHTRVFSKQNKHYLNSLSPQIGKHDLVSSHFINLSSPSDMAIKKQAKFKQFIPKDVVFTSKQRQKLYQGHGNMNQSSSQQLSNEKVGQFLIEDFLVISPDIIELKRMKQSKKDDVELTINEFYYFNYNPTYKNRNGQYLKDIAKRSFPLGAKVSRKSIQTFEDFRQELQFTTAGKMGEEYFILNLKGDLVDNQSKETTFIENCNPYKALFAVCLRVPDFIPIRDQKYYQKQEQQVWKVQKVYAILTYHPFFNIHLSVLSKIHHLLQPQWHKLQKQQMLSKNLQRNLSQIQKSQHINKLINYLTSKKPDYNQNIVIENHYFGAVPNAGYAFQFSIARFSCPIFFSIFAYEQMLLLLTAIFLQKSIIFVSKSQSAATLCALFLTTVINPFKYNQHLILNCDTQKIETIVFQFPFILMASIKKSQNFPNILRAFIDNNNDRFKGFDNKNPTGPLILVDLDSNCIFYDPLLNKIFEELIISPSEQFKQAYLAVNQFVSKTFSLPKKMLVQVSSVPKNDYQKNEQIRRKIQKEYQQKIDNNLSKWPTYELNDSHLKVLRLLAEYIQSFGINSDYQSQLIRTTMGNNQARKTNARKHLLSKHPMRHKLVNVIVESQLFADYLDDLQKKIESGK